MRLEIRGAAMTHVGHRTKHLQPSTISSGEQARPALRAQKLALVHVALKQTGLSEAEYRELLRRSGGVSSAKELSETGFRQVMLAFEQLGFVQRTRKHFGARAGMATPAQLVTIRRMWSKWSNVGDDASLNRWIAGRFGISALRFADVGTAQRCIEALKAMLRRAAADESAS
ncbi:regulatory protein GemA [Piscinibacter koreensis]|uniref:Regulatory protein GemA n=1 Tax=Piscinibacter koreensis TaxID=2742824 RepID=A0A7Y6TX31_9BURK|nr:regulatory protein GemA [Schlegelella koreensis]NUZ06723.1 regulatory protein GemA [Schlegelella koreensis]